ncbi:MAG: electron transfer flavoprotein subunit alpha/FixB family protein, partial [Kiloniellales bacterium]
MSVLVVAEHDGTELRAATLNTVAAAKAIGGELHILVAGQGCKAAAEAAAKIEGAAKVLLADEAALEHLLAENLAPLIAKLAPNYSHVLAPASTFGKNVMPRAAALLDVQQISDISEVVSPDTFVRPIYAGNAMATVQSSDAIKVITVRSTAFDAAAAEGGSAAIENVGGAEDSGLSRFLGQELT